VLYTPAVKLLTITRLDCIITFEIPFEAVASPTTSPSVDNTTLDVNLLVYVVVPVIVFAEKLLLLSLITTVLGTLSTLTFALENGTYSNARITSL